MGRFREIGKWYVQEGKNTGCGKTQWKMVYT